MKLIAKTKDGDIYEVRLQRMFPNCERYTKCCTDDAEFWDKLEKKTRREKPTKQPFRAIKRNDPPEGF